MAGAAFTHGSQSNKAVTASTSTILTNIIFFYVVALFCLLIQDVKMLSHKHLVLPVGNDIPNAISCIYLLFNKTNNGNK